MAHPRKPFSPQPVAAYRLRVCSFSAIELLAVMLVLCVLVIASARYVSRTQKGVLQQACRNHLKQTGVMAAQYQSPAMFDAIPLAGEHTAYDCNEATLDPYICFRKSDLLKDEILLCCPLGRGPIVYGPRNPGSVAMLAGATTEPTRAATRISSGTEAASNYLFTWFYTKESPDNRVIAGDAAAAAWDGFNNRPLPAGGGFSPNHGDTADRRTEGANALFRDGSVSACEEDYALPQAQLRTGGTPRDNPWDVNAPAALGADGTGSRIGHY